jgi:hypothetical protein
MAQTIEQKIAETEAKLARLRQQSRALENGQKIILGGMLLAEARKEPRIRQWLIDKSNELITRDVDRKRLEPLLAELAALPTSS